MKKTLLIILISIAVFLMNISTLNALVENPISVVINGKNIIFDTRPIIENGRVLVPLRKISETLNVNVKWDPKERTVTCIKDNMNLKLTIGNNDVIINKKIVTLETPAKIITGRTMVPLRFVSEAFGSEVSWNENLRTIQISNKQSDLLTTTNAVQIIEKINFLSNDKKLDVKALQKELEQIKDINGESLFILPINSQYGIYDNTTTESVFQLQMFLESNGYLTILKDSNQNKLYGKWDNATQNAYIKYVLDPKKKQFYFNANINNTWPEVQAIKFIFGRNDIIYFSQRDLRWAYLTFSNHNDKTQTIGMSACGPTAMSIIISTLLGKEVTPIETCAYALNNGYRSYDNGVPYDSGYYENIATYYGLQSTKIDYSDIEKSISEGKIVLALMKPTHFTGSGHYIVFDDIVTINNNKYLSVLDPNHCNENYSTDQKVIDYVKNDGSVLTTIDLIKSEGVVFMAFSK
jgi:hypothetical protein